MKEPLQLPWGIFLEFKTEYEFQSLPDHVNAENLSRDVRMDGDMFVDIVQESFYSFASESEQGFP